MRVAALDCGTNTVKLLVLDHDGSDLEREMRIVRLGQDVDRTGRLAEEALARTFAAIEEYAGLVARHDVDEVRFCATSATRDSANASEFAAGVRARLGVDPEVLSGAEEAGLAWAGATGGLPGLETPLLVLDIGGGSTELVLGSGATPDAAHSMDVGSVRMTERHLHSADGSPPTPAQVAACVADVDAALDACPVDPSGAATLVGVAGTVTTIAMGVVGLPTYDRSATHGARLPVARVHALCDRLLGSTAEERAGMTWLHPGRADVIAAGALVLSRVLARTRVSELVVSETDILDGIAWSMRG